MNTLGQQSFGAVVNFRESNRPVNYVVAHRDFSSAYVVPANHTLLVRQDVLPDRAWNNPNNNDYQNSQLHAWLNGDFLNTIEASIRNQIPQIRVPFRPGSGTSQTIQQGANGLLCRIFLPSLREVGDNTAPGINRPNHEGARFAWFIDGIESGGAGRQRRIANRGGSAAHWWLRSPAINGSTSACRVSTDGNVSHNITSYTGIGVRPALVLPSSLFVQANGSIVANRPPTVPSSITVPETILGGVQFTVSWGSSTDPDGNLSGYRLERQLDGEDWVQIFQANLLSTTNTVPFGTDSVAYRVRAEDTLGAQSAWQTSPTRTVMNNRPPTAPPSISVPTNVYGGRNLVISWAAGTDPDGDALTYTLERSIDNSDTWLEIFAGPNLSFTDMITRGWVAVTYRVKSVDTSGSTSAWTTSQARTVDNTVAPDITTQAGPDLGTVTDAFSWEYTVTQQDGEVTTVTEIVNGSQIREYTATLGDTQVFDVSGMTFMTILNGGITMTVTATGSSGKSASLSITATKEVHAASVTLKTPLPSDEQISRMILNVVGTIPADAQYKILVTNNALDPSPVWEDATQAVLAGINYLFTNTTAQNDYAFNFRIEVSRGRSNTGGNIATIGGAFE